MYCYSYRKARSLIQSGSSGNRVKYYPNSIKEKISPLFSININALNAVTLSLSRKHSGSAILLKKKDSRLIPDKAGTRAGMTKNVNTINAFVLVRISLLISILNFE